MIKQLNENDLVWTTVVSDLDDYGLTNPRAIVKHIPTELVAECNYERSLIYNQKIALGMLTQQVYEYSQIGGLLS